ncbi:MAG: hypothetical protein K1X38_00540 [Microthrixaceae bacterium]|nr:hypothetical protein [Microthrixaceae bacterium]
MNRTRLALAALICAGLLGCAARNSDTATSREDPPRRTSDTEEASTGPVRSSTDDAVAAAVRFVCSGQQLLDTPPTQLPLLIRRRWSSRAADDAVANAVDRLGELRERLADGSGPTRYRQGVLGVRVASSSGARAKVSVWWVGVLSREGAATPQAQWMTSDISLVLEDGEWRIDTASEVEGPAPDHSSDDEPITNSEFDRRLTGFVDWESNR